MSKNYKVNDIIEFGNFYQDLDGKKQPIEWRILCIKDGWMKLLPEKILYACPFNDSRDPWHDHTIKEWLNGYFYNEAFSKEEKAKIIDYIDENLFRGNQLKLDSKVAILSEDEMINQYGFSGDYDPMKEKKGTLYAQANGLYVDNSRTNPRYNGNGGWWLRSASIPKGYRYVNTKGRIYDKEPIYAKNGVVPCICVKID